MLEDCTCIFLKMSSLLLKPSAVMYLRAQRPLSARRLCITAPASTVCSPLVVRVVQRDDIAVEDRVAVVRHLVFHPGPAGERRRAAARSLASPS